VLEEDSASLRPTRQLSRNQRSTDIKRGVTGRTMTPADTNALFAVDDSELKWESYETQIAQCTAERVLDGAAESFDTSGFTLPPVDLKVVSAKRAHETVQPYTIPDAQRAATPSHIAYCVRQFNADRILVLAAADAARKPFVPPADVSLQAHDIAGRSEHASRAKAPPSDAQWQTTADETLMARRTGVDAVSCTEASTTHSSLFTLRAAQSINWMPAVSAFTDAIDEAGAQKGLDAFQWEPACRLLLDFQSVEWESGVLEPLVLSATVWDLERRERVSETFSVEVNNGEWRQALGEYDRSDAKLAARSCILSLPAMLPSFVVVVSAARPLRGEIDEVLEPMSKGGELKPKDAQKLAAEAKATVGKLAAHWQTLAWTVMPLFDANGRVTLEANAPLYRARISAYKYSVPALAADILAGKVRALPTMCKMRVRDVSRGKILRAVPGRVSPLLAPMAPASEADAKAPCVRHLLTFIDARGEPRPHTAFTHLLYVYPQTINLSSHSVAGVSNVRNIACEVRVMTDDRDPSGGSTAAAATLAVVFGQALAPALDLSARTTVEYHNRKPRFVDEIKVALPPDVGERHHLLFSFYHVAADVRKLKKGGDTAVLVGQCAVPLLSGRSLLSGEPFSVPVATQLPPNYLAQDALDQVRWIADGKPVFTLQTRVESTVHTHEPTLAKFFAYVAANADLPASSEGSEQSATIKTRLASTLNALATVPLGDLVLHLAPLLGRLIELAASKTEKEDVRDRAFVALLRVLDAATSFDEDGSAVVAPYVRGVYGHEALGGALVHEQLTRLLIRELRAGADRLAEVSRASAPLLLMIYKAICVHAEINGSLREKRARAERVSAAFADQLAELFTLVRTTVATRSRTTVTVAKRLNAAFGRFACQLLDVIDRSKLFQLVSKYVQLLDTERDNAVLSEFKLVFIDAIGAHGYFVALNAPLAYSSLPTLGSELWRRHFLAALQLAEVCAAFDLAKSQPERSHIALQAIDFTWFQFYRLANDGRYAHRLARTRVASLMFALLPLLADRVQMMTEWTVTVKRRASMCAIWLLANVDRAQLSVWWRGESAARRCGLLALLDLALAAFRLNELDHDAAPSGPIAGTASDARTTKQMIESFYGQDPNRRRGVAGTAISPTNSQQPGSRIYAKAGGYRAWAKERTASSLLISTPSPLANSAVGGDGEDGAAATKQAIENVYEKAAGSALVKKGGYRAWAAQKQLKASQGDDDSGSGAGADSMPSSPLNELSRSDSITRGEMKAQRRLSRSLLDVTAEAPTSPDDPAGAAASSAAAESPDDEALADLVAQHEVGLVCIDTVSLFMRDFASELREPNSTYLEPCIGVLCTLAKHRQSTALLAVLLDAIRAVAIDFGGVLFGGESSDGAALCGKLVLLTMRYCASTHTDTRNRAAALLCVLARENQRRVGHIARVKLQATIAVSKLVRRGMERAQSDMSFELLQLSLREAARALTATDRALGAELTALAERSVQVLRDSQRIAEFRWDPETTADLYYDIARGYSDAPDLRVVWLANLAKFHAERQQSVEAANANLVAAALVARCLRALGRDEAGCVPQQFGSVYANAKHEHMAPTRRALAALGNETCRSGAFSEGGVVNLLREAIALFGADQLHEARMACYQLLLPVYEARGNYLARGICHRNLQELCEAIAAARAAGREQRLFANYYRVAFFGRAFGALDGGEFVYREPPSVRLADFTERLQRQFGGKFEVSGGKVALLKNARERVDAAARDPAQPAMQVVSLEPHFEREDAARRGTSYERAVNLSLFVFQTPFTVDNKAHGDVASQHILRSVVRTDVPLPSTRKRVRIVERRDSVLTPIEVGAEMIESKSNLLRRELGEREIAFDEADVGDDHSAALADAEAEAVFRAAADAIASSSSSAAASDANADTKSLQMILQGALLLQVNAGPLEVFRTFLAPAVVSTFDQRLVARLRRAMLRFWHLLERGVALNGRLVGEGQLQTALLEGLQQLHKELTPFIGNN
jgi:hypothetical protein